MGGYFLGMFTTRKERQRCCPAFHGLVTRRMLLYEELIRGGNTRTYVYVFIVTVYFMLYLIYIHIYSLRFRGFLYVENAHSSAIPSPQH